MSLHRRICSATGLGLVSTPDQVFRISKTSYGPLAPKVRTPLESPLGWSRFDTVGRTLYAADSVLTSYLELLAPFRTVVADKRRALEPAARIMGMSLDEYWEAILNEWGEQGNMHAMWLPRTFREGRAVYTLELPEGWWIDARSAQTLSMLDELFPQGIELSDKTVVRNFTISDLSSDSRELTTAIATALRNDIDLDDGSLPLGIHFTSKHGDPSGESGGCWAYWQRALDNGMEEPTRVSSSRAIDEDDPALLIAQRLCKIKMR